MRQRKIPTLIGLLLVLGAVFIFSVAFDRLTPLLSRASPGITPKNITFSNVTDTSFTVTWTTDTPATGAVIVDGSGIGTAYDQRDEISAKSQKTPVLGSYNIHSVMIRSARPETSYHIRIISDGKFFQDGINPYSVTTGPVLTGAGTAMEPAYGKVTLPNDKPATGAVVLLTLEGAQTLSAFVTETGSWVVPLHLVRTKDLKSYMPNKKRIRETITVYAPEGVTNIVTDSVNDNPVPAVIIGKTYDFRNIRAEISPEPLAVLPETPEPAVRTTPAVLSDTAINENVAITQPENGAHLPTDLPLFTGTGVIGNQVLVLVGVNNPQSATEIVGTDGIWRYTPAKPLSAGKQSVTITTKDKSGKTVALTNIFEILKSGTQVLGDATPSATIEPTATPTTYVEDTVDPTSTLAGEQIPTTGNELPTILLLIFGVLFLAGGGAILFL